MKTRPILWYIALVLTMALGYVGGHFDSLSAVGHGIGLARTPAEPAGLPLWQRQRSSSKAPDVGALATQVSGQFNTVPPTFPSGAQIPIQTDAQGRIITVAAGGNNVTIVGPLGSQVAANSVSVAIASDQLPLTFAGSATPSDAFANPTNAVTSWALNGVWNGATWARWTGTAGVGNVFDTTVNTSVGTVNTSIGTMSAKLPAALGQGTMAQGLKVAFASDQSAIPVNATVVGPLGAQAQAASVAITDNLQLPASLGQKTMAASEPIVIASDQSAVPVSGTVTANVVGATTPTDAFANPTNTVPSFSFNAVWNGATWDRLKGTSGVAAVCSGTTCQQVALEGGNLLQIKNTLSNNTGINGASSSFTTNYAQFGAELTSDNDIGTVKAKNVKGGLNGTFHSIACSVDSTAVGVTWLMFVNKASAPVNGDLPAYPALPMIAGSHNAITANEIGPGGIVAGTGLSWALSSTPFSVTLTTNAANLFHVFIEYH